MNPRTVRIATRQSPLALWQANHVREMLLKQWPDLTIELMPMISSGDRFMQDKLLTVGGKGLFVKELEEALLNKTADLAVHSTKDMPAALPDGLCLAAICNRHNPFDALVSKNHLSFKALPKQAVIGTSSLRRQSQLLARRPDLQIKSLRGNINTRLAKLESGEFDAIILAASGLERMGFEQSITEMLPEELMLPACGQGALCIESRTDDVEIQELIRCLNDPISALCVNTERDVNARLGGSCHVPIGIFCTANTANQLQLRAKILSIDGSKIIEDYRTGSMDQAAVLAEQCSDALFAQGAASLLGSTLS